MPDPGWDLTRRQLLHLLGSSSLLGAGSNAQTDTTSTNQQWPQYGHDSRNTFAAPETTSPSGNVEPVWDNETGATDLPGSRTVPSSNAAIAGGRVYLSTKTYNQDGTLDTRKFTARSIVDGSTIWAVSGIETSMPLIADETIFVYAGEGDDLKTIQARRIQDGEVRWQRSLSELDVSIPYKARSHLGYADGTIYVLGQSQLVALDAASGQSSATFSVNIDFEESRFLGLAIAEGDVFVLDQGVTVETQGTGADLERSISRSQHLSRLDGDDLTEIWRTAQPYANTENRAYSAGPPTVSDGMVFVAATANTESGDTSQLGAYDIDSGEKKWGNTISAAISPPSVDTGSVYITNGTGVAAYQAETGTQQWNTQATEGDTSGNLARTAVVGNTILAFAYDFSELRAFNKSGEPQWVYNPRRSPGSIARQIGINGGLTGTVNSKLGIAISGEAVIYQLTDQDLLTVLTEGGQEPQSQATSTPTITEQGSSTPSGKSAEEQREQTEDNQDLIESLPTLPSKNNYPVDMIMAAGVTLLGGGLAAGLYARRVKNNENDSSTVSDTNNGLSSTDTNNTIDSSTRSADQTGLSEKANQNIPQSDQQLSLNISENRNRKIVLVNKEQTEIRCRVRCRTSEKVLFTEDFTLQANETAVASDVPSESFELKTKVADGPTGAATFQSNAVQQVQLLFVNSMVDITARYG